MNSNLNSQKYNYDYSLDSNPINNSLNRNIHSARIKRNNSYIYNNHNNDNIENNIHYNNINTNQNINLSSNIFRINSLEERILSLEKNLQYFDEFIHLKEEEKNNNPINQDITILNPLIKKINLLEKEIKSLHKEKEENRKIISELTNKITNLEKKVEKYDYYGMQDLIESLSNKEKKLNMLINDFSDIVKEANTMINKKMDEKINGFNIFNENRINELLVLILDINKIIEENEIKVNKVNENIQNVQKDNLNIIKFLSIQEQKFNSFDLIINEINNLKEKFYILTNDFDRDNKINENLNIELLK